METLTKIFNQERKTNLLIVFFSSYCLFLLLLRAKITHSIFLFFLIWNLFLATVPYFVISYLSANYKILESKFKTGICLTIWLLFLPNSFYIITDIIHISKSNSSTIWYDLILILSFAVVGFALGIKSLLVFERISNPIFKPKIVSKLIPIICILNGFGIYLGRILRHNSWEIISNPIHLINSIINSLFSTDTLLFSIHFGFFIYIIFQTIKTRNYL